MSCFWHWHVKGFRSKRITLKVEVLQDRKIYCWQARPFIFQPGNFTGRGSEGVKGKHLPAGYLSNLVPPLVSATNPYHRRRPRETVIPAHKTELFANSFIPSTTQLWNILPQTIQTNPSISLLKKYLSTTDTMVPILLFWC